MHCRLKGKKGEKISSELWIDNPCVLFNINIIPTKKMSTNERTNTITRLIIIITMIMLFFKYPHSIKFFALSIIIILILYFSNNKQSREYFKMDYPTSYKNNLIAQSTPFSKSMQKLSTKPLIFPRSHDKDVWSVPSYKHSAINYNQGNYDISEDYQDVIQKEDYKEFDPRVSKYTDFSLENIQDIINKQVDIRVKAELDKLNNNDNKDNTPIENVTKNNNKDINNNNNDSTPISSLKEKFEYKNGPRREGFTSKNENPNMNNTNNYDDSGMNSIEDDNYLPNQSLLIPKTITNIYGENNVNLPERTKYFQNIQPDIYSYSDTSYPINNNLGITYTPQFEPMVRDQVVNNNTKIPLFHRIDPQLVREGKISKERLEEIPRRTSWSAKYSGFDAADGSVNFEDIYDGKFNGYGDKYSSYGDVNMGQVQYNYSDVSSYKEPNFVTRSKVDFIDFHDPMNRVIPEYTRNVGVNDVKKSVHQQYDADSLYHREDMMEKLMKKRNSELWQQKLMPQSKGARTSTFTSNY